MGEREGGTRPPSVPTLAATGQPSRAPGGRDRSPSHRHRPAEGAASQRRAAQRAQRAHTHAARRRVEPREDGTRSPPVPQRRLQPAVCGIAAGPAGPRARSTTRRSTRNRGIRGPYPGPRTLSGCGAARRGPCAGAKAPGGSAARPRS
jgi:hypothetical protein